MRRRGARPCRGNGRFPYTETTGGLAEIAVGADGARILPNLKNPVRKPATSPLVIRSLPVVDALMKGHPTRAATFTADVVPAAPSSPR